MGVTTEYHLLTAKCFILVSITTTTTAVLKLDVTGLSARTFVKAQKREIYGRIVLRITFFPLPPFIPPWGIHVSARRYAFSLLHWRDLMLLWF